MKKSVRLILLSVLLGIRAAAGIALLLLLFVFYPDRTEPGLVGAFLIYLFAGAFLDVLCFLLALTVCGQYRRIGTVAKAEQAYLAGDESSRAPEYRRGLPATLAKGFNRAADSRASSLNMRADFMNNVSHDMKTPMTVINGYVTNLRNGAIPREQADTYLKKIQTETMRLSKQVGLFLDVSRIDAGDWEYAWKEFDLCEVVGETLTVYLDELDRKNLQGDFDTPEDSVFVYGDRDAVSRALDCLVSNAVRYTPQGKSMRITVEKDGNSANISVYNEGEGIPYEDQPFVFDRSFKGDRSRGTEKDSFGLGLYICKKIVEGHGSELILESTPGKDCRFSFSLPLTHPTNHFGIR